MNYSEERRGKERKRNQLDILGHVPTYIDKQAQYPVNSTDGIQAHLRYTRNRPWHLARQ